MITEMYNKNRLKGKENKKKRNTKKYKYNSTNKEKSNDREWLAG